MRDWLLIGAFCVGLLSACTERAADGLQSDPLAGAGRDPGASSETSAPAGQAQDGAPASTMATGIEGSPLADSSERAGDGEADDPVPEGTAGSGAVEGGEPSGGAGAPAMGPAFGGWVAGDYPPDLMSATYLEISGVDGQKGYTRQYKVHVPPSYDPAVPTPLVFCIHGLTQDPLLFCVIGSSMVDKSDEEGFILVMPNGYGASWNGGTCCGAASVEQLDDVALMRAIFEEVAKHLNVDRGRVYATGHSNGGFMSYRLACEASDIFTAVAPSAGGIGTNDLSAMDAMWDLAGAGTILGATNAFSDFTECSPTQPISVLDLHGTLDGLVPHSFQEPSLALIAERNGCEAVTEPAVDPMSRGDTNCVSHAGCPGGLEVTGCTVEGGGHNWFGSPDCGTAAGELGCAIVGYNSTVLVATDAVWDFFSRHAR